jgi:hypothetical protein
MTKNEMYEITKTKLSDLCEQMKYAWEDEFPDVDCMTMWYEAKIEGVCELAKTFNIGQFYFKITRFQGGAIQVTLYCRRDMKSNFGTDFKIVYQTSDNMDYKEMI